MILMLEKEAPSSPFRLGQEGSRSHWRARPGQLHSAYGREATGQALAGASLRLPGTMCTSLRRRRDTATLRHCDAATLRLRDYGACARTG